MPRFDFDIGILGGGAAGLTVAAGAARLGAKTLLVETEARLGGDCLHYGCVPSKTLIKTARVFHLMKSARRFGLPEIKPERVDFRAVAARIQSVISRIQQHDSEERFSSLGVSVRFGRAVFTDEHAVVLGGKTHTAQSWVVATGSSPSIPLIEGLDRTPYVTTRELFSLDRLPESMVLIGGGPVACEMAQAFTRLGSRVTVIEREGQILPREDRDMAELLMELMASEGVTFHVHSTVVKVSDFGGEKEILIHNGSETLGIRAEAIVLAAGRSANTGGMGLDAIGIEAAAKGLAIDSRMRTRHRHIYAAGDVTGAFQFTHAAGYEGSIVISNAIFHLPRRADYRFMPWCTYTDPEVASIGMNERTAKEKGIDHSVWTEEFRTNDRSLTEGEETGKIKLVLDGRGRPLGVQIVGAHAGELLNEWVAALNSGARLSAIAGAVHPYPTLGEINKKIAGSFFAGRIFSPKVRKTLKFLFRLQGGAG